MDKYKYIPLLRTYGNHFASELDLLKNPFEPLGLNVALVHVLLECDDYGSISYQTLSKNLSLNKSYLNRLVATLKEKQLLSVDTSNEDEHKSIIKLTDKGYEVIYEIDKLADIRIQKALSYLTEDEAHTVYKGMKLYTQALKKARLLEGITFRYIEKKDNEPLLVLIKQVLAEFDANRDGFAFADIELNAMYESYTQAGCSYLVAVKNDELLGGVGIGPLKGEENTVCELRKMYISPKARGIGLGSELLERILKKAISMDYQECYLETLSTMSKAISLYSRYEFTFLKAPRGNTGHFGCDTWMLKSLTD